MTVTSSGFHVEAAMHMLPTEVRAVAHEAEGDILALEAALVPKRTGKLLAAMRPHIHDTPLGADITLGVASARVGGVSLDEVVRWVSYGTAGHGTGKIRPKRARALALGGGIERADVRGQRPDPFLLKLRVAADMRLRALMERGAERAARVAERVAA
jgi:hypothetical protein